MGYKKFEFEGKLRMGTRGRTDLWSVGHNREGLMTDGALVVEKMHGKLIGVAFGDDFLKEFCKRKDIKPLKREAMEHVKAKIVLEIPKELLL